MKVFLKKAAALALGCAIITGLLFAFVYRNDYNGFFGGNPDYNPDNPTGKMALYKKDPLPNIIIGDSRLNEMRFHGDYIEELTGERYFNMAFGGASMLDCANLFWYCNGVTAPKRVYIAVSFYRMQANDHEDRVPIVQDQFDRPLTYLYSIRTLETSWKMFRERLAERDAPKQEKEKKAEEDLLQPTDSAWREQKTQELVELMYGLCTHREGYAINEKAMRALIEVAEYCAAQGIELYFVALPSNPEVYRQIIEPLELDPYIEAYKEELSRYAPVIDMEFRSDFSADAANFRDALHLEPLQHKRFLRAMFLLDDPMVRVLDNRE